jgi:HEAT repeat protein
VKTVGFTTIMLLLSTLVPARAQLSNANRVPGAGQLPGTTADPTDIPLRYQKSTLGRTIEDWAGHLEDADPGRRLAAVRLLAESGDPKANQYLTRAVGSQDARVATSAVDSLGKAGAKEAAEILTERLFLRTTPGAMRLHILAALDRIRDPASARRVLIFAQGEADPEIRATTIHVIGEIGDGSVRDDLQKLSEIETDPKVRTLLQDAVAEISVHGAPGATIQTDPLTTFSHSEPSR